MTQSARGADVIALVVLFVLLFLHRAIIAGFWEIAEIIVHNSWWACRMMIMMILMLLFLLLLLLVVVVELWTILMARNGQKESSRRGLCWMKAHGGCSNMTLGNG